MSQQQQQQQQRHLVDQGCEGRTLLLPEEELLLRQELSQMRAATSSVDEVLKDFLKMGQNRPLFCLLQLGLGQRLPPQKSLSQG